MSLMSALQDELIALERENRALWEKVRGARASMKRDLARCRAVGDTEEKRGYQRWFKELEELEELNRFRSRPRGTASQAGHGGTNDGT